MQYIAYVKLAVVILNFIRDYRQAKANGGDEGEISAFVAMLGKIGEASGIVELNRSEITTLAPEIINLIKAVKGLKAE